MCCIMEEGTYYIGDMYCMITDDWSEVCQRIFPSTAMVEGKSTLKSGVTLCIFGTARGDGTYDDTSGNSYSVDSGTIGCISIGYLPVPEIDVRLGHVVTFNAPFECYRSEGWLVFGNVKIDTDPVGNSRYNAR